MMVLLLKQLTNDQNDPYLTNQFNKNPFHMKTLIILADTTVVFLEQPVLALRRRIYIKHCYTFNWCSVRADDYVLLPLLQLP